MSRNVLGAGLLAAAVLTGGCATKKYVQETTTQATTPIQAKVDQATEQNTKQDQQITQLQGDVKGADERAQSGISGAKEQAMTAQNHAGEAMNKANQANDLANKDSQEIAALRQSVGNLDDYKKVADATIQFAFNKYALTDQDKADLDNLAATSTKNKRYFIALEGFTDQVGSKQYNEALSRKRADAVAQYLVAKHDIPIFRIHTIGLGEEKLVDDGRTKAARAKNRRVEVKVFSADESYSVSQLKTQSQPSQPQ